MIICCLFVGVGVGAHVCSEHWYRVPTIGWQHQQCGGVQGRQWPPSAAGVAAVQQVCIGLMK